VADQKSLLSTTKVIERKIATISSKDRLRGTMANLYLFVFSVMVVLSQQRVAVQDLMGTWQGVLRENGQDQRTVIKVLRNDGGTLQGALYPIDKGGGYLPVSGTVRGGNITLSVPAHAATFSGKLDISGNSISGTWTENRSTQPFNLIRATADMAWKIPDDPLSAPKMASDIVPAYEVATFKLSLPGENRSLFRQGRRFNTTNTSIVDLMMFAYGIHPKQIANAPRWLETDKFDVTLLQAGEGQPSDAQLKEMMRQLLSDRLRLTLHREKRDVSVYRIVTLKAGTKLVESLNADGPAGVGSNAGVMTVKSGTMADFAGFLQRYYGMDRPVLDKTGLAGRYDFTLRWTPDDRPKTAGVTDEFPDFFTAIQQQLGLKLEPATESVDVLAIDEVERPTEN
jgi:uncharacterized protein (TIGR03435 family)